jgi:two-component system, OmpR family, sensor histidine kinase KdpD
LDVNAVAPRPGDAGLEAAPDYPASPGQAPAGPGAEAEAGPEGAAAAVAGELKQLQELAELAEVAGLAIFSTVAHELRGPLMALATSAELLVADFAALEPAQIRELVAGIHCRALWLQELVENLLCAASLREGGLAMHFQPLNMLEVVAEVRQVVLPLLRRRAQRLRIHETAAVRPPEVHADGRRLGQVLVNLILNASKFSPPETSVDVILSTGETALKVTVADRGPGLPEGVVEQLFEPFFRAPSTQVSPRAAGLGASAPEGVGLGLAIAKEIVSGHGGRIGAGDRRGGGARFWFELPLG